MMDFSAKTDIRFNLLRCMLVGLCVLFVIFAFIKPLGAFEIRDSEQFNRNLKNYNVKLQILKSDQTILSQFSTAIANDNSKKRTGLMNLKSLPQNHAMLFTFEKPKVISMWMKNTIIALDMLFIDENGRIVSIAADTKPYSLEIISSNQPVVKVLEINAGLSKKLGIKIGHMVKILNEK